MTNIDITLKTGTVGSAGIKKLPVGNFGDYFNFTIQDSAGAAVNITGMTPKLTLYRPGPQRHMDQRMQVTCSIVSGSGGTCRYQVANGDFTEMLDYLGRVDLYTSTTKIDSTQEFMLSVI